MNLYALQVIAILKYIQQYLCLIDPHLDNEIIQSVKKRIILKTLMYGYTASISLRERLLPLLSNIAYKLILALFFVLAKRQADSMSLRNREKSMSSYFE